VIVLPILVKTESLHCRNGLGLPRARHPGEIALAGARCLHSTLAAAPVLFVHAVVTAIKIGSGCMHFPIKAFCVRCFQDDGEKTCRAGGKYLNGRITMLSQMANAILQSSGCKLSLIYIVTEPRHEQHSVTSTIYASCCPVGKQAGAPQPVRYDKRQIG
jgi:hypothetical protein